MTAPCPRPDVTDPAFWPATMTADGVQATAEQMALAMELFFRDGAHRRGGRQHFGLTSLLNRKVAVKVVGDLNTDYPTHRLADRMLQYARRKGAIRFRRGPNPQWERVQTNTKGETE